MKRFSYLVLVMCLVVSVLSCTGQASLKFVERQDAFVPDSRSVLAFISVLRQADADRAVANALQCYEDGIFRMFLNGCPLGDICTPVEVMEGDCLSVVRLTLLAGRM